jgi:hypothetical protein
MKNVIITICLAVTVMAATVLYGGTITFNDGGSHEFNSYTTDTLAVEDSLGGNPTTLSLVSGTYVDNHYVYAYDFSKLNVIDGYAYATLSMDSSAVNIIGGEVMYPHSHNSSTTTVSGGECYRITAHDSSTLNLTGGDITYLSGYDSSIINVYGTNLLFTINTGGGKYGEISGNWANGTAFYILLYNAPEIEGADTYSHINLVTIPEPATLLLLGFGGVILRRKKKMEKAEITICLVSMD